MRGRLVFPFLVEVVQLDTLTTSIDPDGAGPLTSGYDVDFKEPVRLPPGTGAGPGASALRYKTPVQIPAQIEQGEWLKLKAFFNGDSPDTKIVCVMHFPWLEDNGYVDDEGNAMIRIGDRMTAIYDEDGVVQATIKDPVFVTQVQPGSFGLGRKRNLLFVYFDCRSAGLPA